MKRLSLAIDGTQLDVPILSGPIRVFAISIPASAAATIEILLLDGAGQTALRLTGANALGLCFSVGVNGDASGNIISACPENFIVNTTERLRINASAAIQSAVILSYEEIEES